MHPCNWPRHRFHVILLQFRETCLLNQLLKTFVSRYNPSIQSTSTLKKAIESINLNQEGVVVSILNEKPVGITTERDIVELLHKGADLNGLPYNMAAKKLITTKDDRTMGHALTLILDNNIRRIIVTDHANRFWVSLSAGSA